MFLITGFPLVMEVKYSKVLFPLVYKGSSAFRTW